jgi:glycosyltransferase involved in cell wall biosynthesis
MTKISICIPTYEMKGLGVQYLRENFNKLLIQTYKDFEVIVSDHSVNNDIKYLCDEYSNLIEIKYFKNLKNLGNSSANINNAIKYSSGKLVKVIFQDDFLFNEISLENTILNFDIKKDTWLVSRCEHSTDGKTFIRDFIPHYNDDIHLGLNTISSPSVLTILNDNPLLFDENLIWLMDCDYYKRCYLKYGQPKILNTVTVVNRIGKHQVTNSIVNHEIERKELEYVKQKFNH